jgi:hypothetical protein
MLSGNTVAFLMSLPGHCIGGNMKVLESSTVALCVDVDVTVFETDVLNDCRFGLYGGVKPTVQWCQQ